MNPTKSTLVVNPLSPSAEKAKVQRKPTHDDEGFSFFFSCVKSLLLVSLGKKGFGRKKKRLGA
jgi:hypothetical protein